MTVTKYEALAITIALLLFGKVVVALFRLVAG
jgi:hypothetical protein